MFYPRFLFLALLLVGAAALASDPNEAIEIKIDNPSTSCDPVLNVSLINTSKKNVSINENSLPWSDSFLGVSMIIYDWNSSNIHKPVYLAMQQSDRNIVIKPNQSLDGVINLKKRFIDFDKKVRSKNQVLYWRYILYDAETETETVKVGAVSLKNCE